MVYDARILFSVSERILFVYKLILVGKEIDNTAPEHSVVIEINQFLFLLRRKRRIIFRRHHVIRRRCIHAAPAIFII